MPTDAIFSHGARLAITDCFIAAQLKPAASIRHHGLSVQMPSGVPEYRHQDRQANKNRRGPDYQSADHD